jgi:hypothetical protein
MGAVSQVAYHGGKHLQEFPDVLGPTLPLSVECFYQMVVTVAASVTSSYITPVGTPCSMWAASLFKVAIRNVALLQGFQALCSTTVLNCH